ncbi:MAG: HAMP domain-containing histidine kinase [Lachnospiraceae bacterium]|nr:HAMP domain-containing histidine kinase [Lachnospiraceae bacterium]
MGIEEKDKVEDRDKTEKKEKSAKKGNRAVQSVLGFIQHICLAVMIIAVCVVIGGTTIRVEHYRGISAYNLYAMRDHNIVYEDSAMFNTLFGYALSDIVRHGVVSSQLETNGQFNGKKVIDVTAYNYRSGGLPEQYVTAEYYLEDLLKWSNYGFEWDSEQMTPSQARSFLADTTRVIMIDPNSQYYNTSDASYLKSEIETYTFVSDVSGNMLWTDVNDYDGFVEEYYDGSAQAVTAKDSEYTEEIRTYNFLVNRYKTVDKKNLEEYVSDWDLYYDLCHNVQNAAKGLAYNYNEYLECGEYYSTANSNVRYMIVKTVGDNVQIYTNLTDEPDYYLSLAKSMISGEISGGIVGHESDKYIYYSPADMVYRSNTSITENTVRQVFQSYDYAYPETVRIWLSVDGMYPVNDAFQQGYHRFYEYVPYLWPGVATAAAAGILYLMIWIYLICVTGKDADEEGKPYIRLSVFDEIPTEAALLIACGVMILAFGALLIVSEFTNINPTDIVSVADEVFHYRGSMIIAAAIIFASDFLAMFFFYSLIRRIRSKTLWKNSYLRRAGSRVIRFGWKVYDNGDIVIRTWLPYAAFLLFNIVMLIWAFISDGLGSILTLLFLAAVDILVGNLLYRNAKEQRGIVKGIETIAGGQLEYQVDTENLHGDNLTLARSVNSIGNGIKEAVEISMKDERMKADLITNVSHDIKTPLTSIINYVDLIKREQVENEKIRSYIGVLDEKSQRLKQLTDDLVEASKISSGNISLQFEKINLTELMNQTLGEFSEKFEQKNLTTVMNINAQNAVIEADSRRIWRVMENLFNNVYKYAMEGTRVYVTINTLAQGAARNQEMIEVSVKNISAMPLNCAPDELTERFIRGDESRTTEGSGLGLSIARDLTQAQHGTFEIRLDGDLFKVILTFPLAEK